MKPVHAIRASAPPTLMRRTPRSEAVLQRWTRRADQEIDGLWMHRFHHGRNLFRRRDAGRIEAIGAGFGVSREPVDHELQILLAAQERLAAAGEHDAAIVGIDRLARRLDAIDGERAIEQRFCVVAGKILDRQTRNAGLHGARDIGADLVRFVRKAVFEVGINRDIDRRADRGQMGADVVDGDAVVGLGDGPGEACARGSQRLEAEMLQGFRAADIERIGDDEASALVQFPERGALVSSCQHGHSPSCLFASRT